MENEKEITMDALASMVQKGFDGVDGRLDKIDGRLDGVENRLGNVETRLERIEKLLLAEHQRRIERLEDDVQVLKDALNIK